MRPATMSMFFALLALAANGLVVLALATAAAGSSRSRWPLRDALADSGLALAFLVATVATLGSLYYSEIAGFEPCVLCWYQRIAMYPLPVIIGVALLRRDGLVARYVLPLAVTGGLIAAYHYLLQWFPQLSGTTSCTPDAPCTAAYTRVFGFVTIPYMALSGFVLIAVATLLARPAATRATAAAGTATPIRQGEAR